MAATTCMAGTEEAENLTSLPLAGRKFYDLPSQQKQVFKADDVEKFKTNSSLLMQYVEENVIGKDKVFCGPYGLRKVVYCDYTASGKSLHFIEDYIRDNVLPEYGNTHTTTTVTSLQTTLFRHEARDIIRNACNASEHDAVIFAGSGCTAAVHKLIHALHFDQPPVVFVGPYEHHSNLLPWKEMGATVHRIRETDNGLVDSEHLEELLRESQSCGRRLIGCFSAASNVTGILVDTVAITILLHRYGALAFWDYATSGPYVEVDMNPVVTSEDQSLVYKDAVFLSPHKFIGGVGTPGLLIAKKSLFQNPVPSGCGGGSVFFVRRDAHRYLQETEMREEGGTPAIVESVRAGLTFQLKEAITSKAIHQRELELCRRAMGIWRQVPNLIILGNTNVPRLPIFSFLMKHPETGKFLHHNFVCSVLNDIFGVQARGGCACAGPYAQDLLGLPEDLAEEIEKVLVEDSRLDRVHLRRYREYSEKEILRPGFSRLGIPYFMKDEDVDFILDAVKMVAEHGWKLLPHYMFNPETGEWRHRNHQVFKDRKWLGNISYLEGRMTFREPQVVAKGPLPNTQKECILMARLIFDNAGKTRPPHIPDQTILFDKESSKLRWFVLPSEVMEFLKVKGSPPRLSMPDGAPFHPPQCPVDESAEMDGNYPETNSRKLQPQEAFKEGMEEILASGFKQDWTSLGSTACDGSCRKNAALKSGAADQNSSGEERNVEMMKNTGKKDQPRTMNSSGEMCQKATENSQVNGYGENEDSGKLPNTSSSGTLAQSQATSDGNIAAKDMHIHDIDGSQHESSVTKSLTNAVNEEQSDGAVPSSKGSVENNSDSAPAPSKESVANKLTVGERADDAKKVADESEPRSPPQTDSTDSTGAAPGNAPPPELLSCEFEVGETRVKPKGLCEKRKKFKRACAEADRPLEGSGGSGDPRQPQAEPQGPPKITWQCPPKSIFKPTVQAMEEFDMLKDGDRVMVCLSGGKDSLSLLHTMKQYQHYLKKKNISFELGAVTVDPMTPSYDPSPLIKYCAALGVPYAFEQQCIMETAKSLAECASICSFCSRMKRGRIYTAARREGYNVLALGQHLDDLAESFMMSSFHNGLLRTMKAHYTIENGDLRVIRPFVFAREKDLRKFAEQRRLPVIAENCPACFEAPKERHRIKQLLAQQEILFPRLYFSLLSAIKPLMSINRTGVNMRSILEEAHAVSTKDKDPKPAVKDDES